MEKLSYKIYTKSQLAAMRQQSADVPCGGCTSCCRNDKVRLTPGDSLGKYQWHLEGGKPVLDRKEDGSCVYLDSLGCTIHDERPMICRQFDCRVLALSTSNAPPEVYEAGVARLHTLGAA